MNTGLGDGRWIDSVKLAVALLIVQPFIVKAALLFNILKSDPRVTMSGLGSAVFKGLGGTPTIDPNIAFTSHAIGSLAARSVVAGEPVWWNPYEGVGAPLAGEMQSAALFPLTWLMALPNGQLIEHLLFQVIAGCTMFFLLRKLGLRVLPSWFGGTAFAFNGTFAWLANAVINPICFLPVIVLGIEYLRDPGAAACRRGGLLVSIGLAASLYAGFPETAYLDGLLVLGWTLVRAGQQGWADRAAIAFLGRVGVFGVAGCLIAAPIMLAFFDYLQAAYIGSHDGSGVPTSLRPSHAAMMLVPYLPGALSRGHVEFWGSIGGYSGMTLAVLAASGAWSLRDRPLALLLGGWCVIAIASIYGIEPITTLVNAIPGVGVSVVYRYIEPSLFFALALLAAVAIDTLMQPGSSLVGLRRALVATLLVAAGLSAIAWGTGIHPTARVEVLLIAGQLVLTGGFVVTLMYPGLQARWRAVLVAGSSVAEMIFLFAIPLLSYPLDRKLDLRGIEFMQRTLGFQRFVSLGEIGLPGSIAANYGSYFQIGQINWNDLPAARPWVDYVRRHLEPQSDAIIFRTTPQRFAARIDGYAAIGTKYVTTPRASPLSNLHEVFSDSLMRIYVLPGVRPYFVALGCRLMVHDRTKVTTMCSRPSQVERLELLMDGWAATVAGQSAPIHAAGEIFQAVNVPAGTSTTEFTFTPPSVMLGYVLAILGGLLLVGGLAMPMRTRKPESPSDRAMAA